MEDQTMRAAVAGAVASGVGLLKGQLQTYLARKKAETGRGLPERLGYQLGRLWTLGNHSRQKTLNGR